MNPGSADVSARRRRAPSRDRLWTLSPERLRVDEALLEDFLDGLPDPIGVNELADLLAVPRGVIQGRLRRGALEGHKAGTRWVVTVEGNREWIASRWRTAARRRCLEGAAPAEAIRVTVDDPRALLALRGLTGPRMTAAQVITAALLEYRAE